MDHELRKLLMATPKMTQADVPWELVALVEDPDEPRTFEELNARLDVRVEALQRGRTDWGCAGKHTGRYTKAQIAAGAPNCPQWLHHHHDPFCREPSDLELRLAGVEKPEHGWGSRG